MTSGGRHASLRAVVNCAVSAEVSRMSRKVVSWIVEPPLSLGVVYFSMCRLTSAISLYASPMTDAVSVALRLDTSGDRSTACRSGSKAANSLAKCPPGVANDHRNHQQREQA